VLDIAETTVKVHVQHIFRKLKLSSRVQVAVFAAARGFGVGHTPIDVESADGPFGANTLEDTMQEHATYPALRQAQSIALALMGQLPLVVTVVRVGWFV
jgi:hypothetical protein